MTQSLLSIRFLAGARLIADENVLVSILMYSNQYSKGEPGYHSPMTLQWFEVPNYPISRLADGVDKEWFENEVSMWAEEGQPDRFDSMISKEIVNSVIVFDDGIRGWTWDGNHRIGATLMKNIPTIRAYVGIPLTNLSE